MPKIADVVELSEVLAALKATRPVFYSEADFQHALGQTIHHLDPSIAVRLEVGQGRRHLDLFCSHAGHGTAIELKYRTNNWAGTVGGEEFLLRNHGAPDLARQGFVFDIARLEEFCRDNLAVTNGLAILLTNDPSLWAAPRTGRPTRDAMFRIHEGRTLTGVLKWGDNDVAHVRRSLEGTYNLVWQEWGSQEGRFGLFRALVAEVTAQAAPVIPVTSP